MKAIIQAYSPKELERIARGEQTVKVCKTAPKETPFKVYIYQAKESKRRFLDHRFNSSFAGTSHYTNMGKVVGEYVCERVDTFKIKASCATSIGDKMVLNEIAGKAGIRTQKLIDYFRFTKEGKALHISAVKFYDKPKEMGEFKKVCPMKISDCAKCEFYSDYSGSCTNWVTHAPHGWQYVEELNYGL